MSLTVLTRQEQSDLISQPNIECPTGLRNWAILRLMLNAGLKLAEVIGLSWDDLDWDGHVLAVKNTHLAEREIPLGERDLEMLQAWKARAQDEVENFSWDIVFPTLKGTQLKGQYVRQMVRRSAEKAEIAPLKVDQISPGTLRHTCGADLYAVIRDLDTVQRFMGFASRRSVLAYEELVELNPELYPDEDNGSVDDFLKGRPEGKESGGWRNKYWKAVEGGGESVYVKEDPHDVYVGLFLHLQSKLPEDVAIEALPYPHSTISSHRKGAWAPEDRIIQIPKYIGSPANLYIMAHEVAHCLLDHVNTKGDVEKFKQEVEAAEWAFDYMGEKDIDSTSAERSLQFYRWQLERALSGKKVWTAPRRLP